MEEGGKTMKYDSTSYCRTARLFGDFRRSVPRPAVIDGKYVTAEYKDGVLTVVLKRREPEKAEGSGAASGRLRRSERVVTV